MCCNVLPLYELCRCASVSVCLSVYVYISDANVSKNACLSVVGVSSSPSSCQNEQSNQGYWRSLGEGQCYPIGQYFWREIWPNLVTLVLCFVLVVNVHIKRDTDYTETDQRRAWFD